ncbi:venom serine protease-like, partial [Drosophila tropicalis]|uniref:venom serine protease-like n=1 Tax=Drosophila tropicalis TaxID=46794 RepID=UPI0035ABF25D
TSLARQKQWRVQKPVTAVGHPPPEIDFKISNGQSASKNEFPFLVAIQEIGSYGKIFCGGCIVSDRHIVTVAHCMKQQPNPSKLIARVGDHDLSSDTESRYARKHSIIQIINHPNHVGDYNDIALVLTRGSMEWSWGVAPICLPFLDTGDTLAGYPVEIAGWGSVKFSGPTSDILLKGNLVIIENDRCNFFYNNTIADNQLCTYDPTGKGVDSWQMDSGGPVVLRKRERMFLVGIISYGIPFVQGLAIGVNTRITSHLDWIQSHIRNPLCVR